MKRLMIPSLLLILAILACSNTPKITATIIPSESPTLLKPTSLPIQTVDTSSLLYLTRGDVKTDQAWGIDTDSKGNVYAAGYMQLPATRPFFDMVIYKFDSEGNEVWQTQWGGDFQEKAFVVVVDEPVVYVGGLRHEEISMIEADMALLALDMNTGEVLWDFTWGQGFGYEELDGLVIDGENIYISGWTASEKTSEDMVLLKLDKQGKILWRTIWGKDKFDEGDGQIVVDDTAVYVCGRVNGDSMLTGGDAALVKFSKTDGSVMDETVWGGAQFDDALGMTSDGQYLYLVGLTLSKGNGGQIFLLKYDKELNLVWERIWGGPKGESARVIEVDNDGNLLVAGSTASYGSGADDVVLLKFSPDGDLIWAQTWGGPLSDVVHGMAIDGRWVYLAGNTESFGKGMADALIIKADEQNGDFPNP